PPPPAIVGSTGIEPTPAAIPAPPPPVVDPCQLDAAGFTERVRVFVQIPDEGARGDADDFLYRVNHAPPFKGPGVQVVGANRSPTRLEIRYAYDQDLPAAQALERALTGACQSTGGEPLIRQIAQYQGRVDPRVLEVWWPRPQTPAKGKS
ncbi:hypothetical protein, partial [Nevskia sp.]|uniref:hypothetical protein n=1 Tax=Nevskia sp. TaxID=1929292 RepID=UPI0025D9DADB